MMSITLGHMEREVWQQVDTLYHAALERPAGERAAFLNEALRITQGKFNSIPTDDNGHKRLEPPLNTSEGFLVSGKKNGEDQKGNLELMQLLQFGLAANI